MGVSQGIKPSKTEINDENFKSLIDLRKYTKSFYVVNIIFSFLSEEKKLNLIKYNKKFQNKLGIDIHYYKELSGKELRVETNGIRKEYKLNTNVLIFEGEYLNGKKNGKGKEYYENGKLKFEGEYLNGEKNGKGKEYDENGKIKYEGEYLDDEKNGNGKEYYRNGKLMFEGEFVKDKKFSGKGYDCNNNIIYELKDGNGLFKEYIAFGDIILFECEFKNGKENGKGKEYYDDYRLSFEGEYKNGERNGKGKEYKGDQVIFEGEYLDGKIWNGKGKVYIDSFGNTPVFIGEYLNGKRWNGIGVDFDEYRAVRYSNGEKNDLLLVQ